MKCAHDFYFWGEKVACGIWFCFQYCGDVIWSDVAESWVIVEPRPDKKQYAIEGINRLKELWEQTADDDQPLPLMNHKHERILKK